MSTSRSSSPLSASSAVPLSCFPAPALCLRVDAVRQRITPEVRRFLSHTDYTTLVTSSFTLPHHPPSFLLSLATYGNDYYYPFSSLYPLLASSFLLDEPMEDQYRSKQEKNSRTEKMQRLPTQKYRSCILALDEEFGITPPEVAESNAHFFLPFKHYCLSP